MKPVKGNGINNQSNLTLIENNFLNITNQIVVFSK